MGLSELTEITSYVHKVAFLKCKSSFRWDKHCRPTVCVVSELRLNVRESKGSEYILGKVKIFVLYPSLRKIACLVSTSSLYHKICFVPKSLAVFETFMQPCTVSLTLVWCLRSWTLLWAETHTHVLHFPLCCKVGKQTLIQIVCLVVCLHHISTPGIMGLMLTWQAAAGKRKEHLPCLIWEIVHL